MAKFYIIGRFSVEAKSEVVVILVFMLVILRFNGDHNLKSQHYRNINFRIAWW